MVEIVVLLRIDVDQAMCAIDLIGGFYGLLLGGVCLLGCLLDHLHPVIAIQPIILDHLDQLVGVGSIRGIPAFL